MKVLMISTDKKIFEEGSAVRARMVRYGTILEELHIIILCRAGDGYHDQTIAPNVFVYGTHSVNRYWYPIDAVWKAKRLTVLPTFVTAQDPFECGLSAWRIAKRLGVPLELQIHTDFESRYFKQESGLNRMRTWIAQWTLPRATHIRVVSERIRQSLLAKTIRAPITVLPVFVDAWKLSTAVPTFSLREKYPEFTFHILMISRLTPEKDIETALHALPEVVARYPKTGLIIVGDGFRRSALEALARSLGIHDHVRFEGWQTDTTSYYKGASMFLLTSLYEGYSNVLIEAAANSLPIVATDVGIVNHLLRHQEHLIAVPIQNSSAVRDAIATFITDNNLRHRLSVSAKETVLETAPKDFDTYLNQALAVWNAMLKK